MRDHIPQGTFGILNPLTERVTVAADDHLLVQSGTQIIQRDQGNPLIVSLLVDRLTHRKLPSFGTGVPDGGGSRSIYAGKEHRFV
jgi:hypothetical protein